MIKISTQLLFVCLFLLSQTALASHDVQHLGSVHSDICVVYLSQDHSADSVALSISPILHASSVRFQAEVLDVLVIVPVLAYAPRAPPSAGFFS